MLRHEGTEARRHEELAIGNRRIGPSHPAFVIAEIGVNHDGSLERALELVEHARRAGADGVKVQVFQARNLMHPSASFANYQRDRCEDADPIAMLQRYELSSGALEKVIELIR